MMFLQIWRICSRCMQSFIIVHYTQQSLFFKKSTSVHRILLSTFAFLMHKQYKCPEWKKNDDFLMKICGFWIDFEADFKPSILKQDKADQCRKAHTKGDDRLYRKGRYHQATDFGGGAGRTYGGAGSDCGERDLQPLQFLWANATAIYISHRLSSCVFCDTIAVFDHARLVESGTHTALLAAYGQYAALWNAQAKYYV